MEDTPSSQVGIVRKAPAGLLIYLAVLSLGWYVIGTDVNAELLSMVYFSVTSFTGLPPGWR